MGLQTLSASLDPSESGSLGGAPGPPEKSWLMCFPPQKWSSWTGTRRGSPRKDDTQKGTLSRSVRSAECPEECGDTWLMRKDQTCAAPIFILPFSCWLSPVNSLHLFLCVFFVLRLSVTVSYLIFNWTSVISVFYNYISALLRVLGVCLSSAFISSTHTTPSSPVWFLRSFSLFSLSLLETTSIAVATTSSAWPAWLRKCLQRSQTSSCPTWGPGGSNQALCPLPTPPAHHPLSTPSSPGGWAGSKGWGCGCCQICWSLLPLLLLPLPVFHRTLRGTDQGEFAP